MSDVNGNFKVKQRWPERLAPSHPAHECAGVVLCVGISGLWLAAVALVFHTAVCQQVHHSVAFGSLCILAIVVSSAHRFKLGASVQGIGLVSRCHAGPSPHL
jgi:hypothetical protein